MYKTAKTVVFWAAIALSAFVLWQVARTGGSTQAEPEISYSAFLARVASGQVQKVTITCNLVRGVDAKGGSFSVTVPSSHATMLEVFQQHGVEIWYRDAPTWPTWALYLAPLFLLVALWFVVARQRRRIKRLESIVNDLRAKSTPG